MARKPLSYYLGPHLSRGLLNVYNPVRGLLDAVRNDPEGAGLLAAESVGAQADIKGMVDSSRSAMRNFGRGNVLGGLIDTAYIPANLATLALPGSASGYRKGAESLGDTVTGLLDDVDPAMPRRLVNPEMRVFQGGPNKYGPDIPGTKAGLDSSKIGTGEGAQDYGHGHYLAENPDVAKSYAPRDFDLEEKLLAKYQAAERRGDYEAMEVYERAMMHDTPEEISKWLPESGLGDAGKRANEEYRTLFADVKGGHLYEYDVPDETIDKMLDWDKPLSEQPQAVQDALRGLAADASVDPFETPGLAVLQGGRHPRDPKYDPTGASLLAEIAESSGSHQNTAQISRALREAGIPGIKYLDQGSRAGGEGTNFVLFDDDAAKLLARDDVRFDKAPDLPMDEASRMARGMSEDDFIKHHRTGYIDPSAYERYEADGGLSWLGGPKVEPLTKLPDSGYTIMSDRGKFYVSDDGPTARNLLNRVYDTADEAEAAMLKRINEERGVGKSKDEIYPEVLEKITGKDGKVFDVRRSDTDGMVVFDGDRPVGFSSNEFGTAGVWVEGAYQGQGIGSELLARFMREHPGMKIGQMTPAGENMSRAAYRKLTGQSKSPKKDSANILAGVGGGLLATGVLAEQRKKKDDKGLLY